MGRVSDEPLWLSIKALSYLVLGEPGTGKTILKEALVNHDPKRIITPVVNRTLHTYHNTLRILCQASHQAPLVKTHIRHL